MSEKRTRPAEGRAAWRVVVAVGAMVVACDALAPPELREPIEPAIANDAAEAADPGLANPARGPFRWAKAFIEAACFHDVMSLDIESFKLFRGAHAASYYGAENVVGVIEISTKNPGAGR